MRVSRVIRISVAEAGEAKRQVVTAQAPFVSKSVAQSILGVRQFHTGVVVAVAQGGLVALARPGTQGVQVAAIRLSYCLQMVSMATIAPHHPRTLVA